MESKLDLVRKIDKYSAHVWCADLNKSANEIIELHAVLSEDEKQRAARFHFDKDRNHFVVARGILRQLLSRYIDVEPQKIIFSYSEHGKPFVDQQYNLQFNVSHSHGIALYAFTREPSVGIDIEYKDRQCDIDSIVERYFSSNEVHIIKNLTGTEKVQAFFNGWARKEAFLKALGQGLSYPLANVEVTLIPDKPARFVALHDEQLNINDWCLHALELVPNYAAALVVKGNLQKVEVSFL
jgi:4'-phosphopantetheinyl transferase